MKKDTLLQLADDIEVSLHRGRVTVESGGQRVTLSDKALALLHAFSTPRTLEQALAELKHVVQGRWSWIQLTGEASQLASAGVLRPVDGAPIDLRTHPGRFDSADVHIRMLDDVPRTECYREALRRTIRPGDIVVDVGTGTGILAASAAQAGAAHVFAIERSPNTAKLAQRFFADNGLQERITVIEGASTAVQLPRKANVMVSEVVGNDPLDEGIVQTTQDAVVRLLEPDARLIPGRLRIFALPLEVPVTIRHRHFFSADHIERWRDAYGLDFGVYRDANRQHAGDTLLSTGKTRDWPRLCEPVLVADVDLYTAQTDVLASTHGFRAERDGMLSGVLVFFELDMGQGLIYSIHPDIAGDDNHWASKLWLPPEEIPLAAGEEWEMGYRFDRKAFSQFTFAKVASPL